MPRSIPYSEGKTITPHEDLPTPWDTRLKFGGWYEKDENGDLKDKPFDFTNTIIHGNIKLYPKWIEPAEYTVTWHVTSEDDQFETTIDAGKLITEIPQQVLRARHDRRRPSALRVLALSCAGSAALLLGLRSRRRSL